MTGAGSMRWLLMGTFDQFVVRSALPSILRDFGQPISSTRVVTAYIIALTIAIPIFGRLSDRWSRRNGAAAGIV